MNPADLDISNPPQAVGDMALACIASVKSTVGVELDWTQDTLPILDHYAKTALKQDDDAERLLDLTASLCGAYFGEVVRRHCDVFRWHCPAEELAQWRLELEPAFLYFNPIGVAFEIIEGETIEGWPAHVEVLPRDRDKIDAALKVLGDVREDDYYTFSIRFEVIEQAVQTLTRIASQEKTRPYFGPDVYELYANAQNE